jgi:hypothetical protein
VGTSWESLLALPHGDVEGASPRQQSILVWGAERRQNLAGTAERHAQDGMRVIATANLGLSAHEQEMLAELNAFLFINWIVLVGEQTELGYSRTHAEVGALLQDISAFETLRALLEKYPYIWQIPYNGLELASNFGGEVNEDEMLYFYGELKRWIASRLNSERR